MALKGGRGTARLPVTHEALCTLSSSSSTPSPSPGNVRATYDGRGGLIYTKIFFCLLAKITKCQKKNNLPPRVVEGCV